MKKASFILILITIIFLTASLLYAQSDLQVEQVQDWFTSLTGLAAGTLFVTAYVKKTIKTNGSITIVLSVLISFLLSAVGWYFNLGIFNSVKWYYIFIYGLSAASMANGLSTWSIISDLLTLLKLKEPKWMK